MINPQTNHELPLNNYEKKARRNPLIVFPLNN